MSTASADTSAPSTTPAVVPRRLALAGLTALTLINLLNYLDRYIPSALVADLKGAPLHLSDTRFGFLMSSFLIVYICAAPLFGALGDRGSRIRPIALGVLLWSVATGLSGLSRNYVQLLAARATVGIGEAAYATIAPALLADYFSVSSRGRVLAVFNMAIPVGAALGYVVGGLVAHWYGWRAAFFVAGAPGVLLALWLLRLPDPRRAMPGATESAPRPAKAGMARPWEKLSALILLYCTLLRGAPYRLTVLGYAAYTFALGGLANWMPYFLQSVRGVPQAQATTGFGAIVVVTGFVGTLAGGWLGDYWLRYSREAYLWMSALVTLLAAPAAVLALTASAPTLYYPAIIVAELLLFMSAGPINSTILNLVTPMQRASAIALSVLIIHLLGDVPSPPLIGFISDRTGSLATAVLIVPVAMAVSGILWVWAALASRQLQSGSEA